MCIRDRSVVFILFSFGLLSVAGSPYMPTSDAALPNVVKKENLAEANVIFFSSWGVMAGLGAGLGGYLTTVISRNMLFAIDSLSFVLSALIVFSINKNLSEKSENKKEEDISYKEGLKYAASKKEIFSLIITKATFSISASGLLSLFTVLSYDIYKTGDFGTGLMFAARGIGALIGPIAIRYFFGSSDGKLLNTIGITIMAWGLFYFFIPFSIFVVVGSSNSVNLTDGLDGLAIVPVMIAAACFALIAYLVGNINFSSYLQLNYVPGVGEIAIVLGALFGAGLGFLWFNAPPAEIFMGDTGSLSLGGVIGISSVATRHELVLVIIGGLFVVETISVILQVGYFKLTGKRIFLMAPLHHHFEKRGWEESTIVIRFWIIAVILALIGLSTLKLR